MNQAIGYTFIVIGLIFDFLGCIGLIRLPDIYNRLQATTKCVTLGTCGILLGTVILKGFCTTSIKAILTIVFLFLTSPVAAHALARGAYKSGVRLWDKSVCDKYGEDSK